MKVILSPAKSINEDVEFSKKDCTQYVFQEESQRLAVKMAKLSALQIKKLMGVSNDLANLNFNRYQNWKSDDSNSKPAAYLFTGAAYQAMSFTTLSKEDQNVGQDKLRILSGLYGLLKPLDLIQPYRLEMGTSFKVTPKVTNLYKFWGDKIRNQIESEMAEDEILVNAASSEYFKAVQLDKLNRPVITTIFQDKAKDGSYKVIMTYAKLARGHMSRFIIEENINTAEELKTFDRKGFYFSAADSSESEFIYKREVPQL
ncbi:MAG: cytoplasmic iron level regulating protein YaaA (DUF328/UPF0246 family) [Arenicella sp.]|jgi:cytoplasmic iron level regulating protein YaaA (DUF328/UPF0246 family)